MLLLTAVAVGNEISYRMLQSGSPTGPTPMHDRGIRGEGQIIAILDTGLDWDNCYFAEPGNLPPPINTGSPTGGYQFGNVDLSRRKVIGYDFLASCNQFPAHPFCENANSVMAFDNHGHGTHAAGSAAGDRGAAGTHDYGDAIAPLAKLIIQDAGISPFGDSCSQLLALGCPIENLGFILELADRQGARIHSNSWGDRQGVPPVSGAIPPTGNYSESARVVDQFAWTHPDFLILFNSGNAGALGPSSISAPGTAKNAIQVGGTRSGTDSGDDILAPFSGFGPTRDGRIKPDLVGPAWVVAGDSDYDVSTRNCDATSQPGTSWASPTIAGAVALVRQYYTEGFYPSGRRNAADARTPSAALLKATLIASARRVPLRDTGNGGIVPSQPVPSYQQGFGFPVLDDALYFEGDRARLRIVDVSSPQGLSQGTTHQQSVTVRPGTKLKVVLGWTDPPGTPAGATSSAPQLVNDLDLEVRASAGVTYGNDRLHPGAPDRLNNVEAVELDAPDGTYEISVRAHRIGRGSAQSFALVIVGDLMAPPARRRSVTR